MAKTCEHPKCNQPAMARKNYCDIHEIQHQLFDSSHKAVDRGDYLGGIIGLGLSKVIDLGHNWYNEQKTNPRPFVDYVKRGPDPFKVLGLDAKTATVADIRRIQKGAAAMWHSDSGGGSMGEEKLKEINEAAAACIKIIKSRKKS